jgi:hypothetical protein
MEIDFGNFDLAIDGESQRGVPLWFSGLAKFAYKACSTRSMESKSSEHFVISLPDIDGALTAISLGSLAAEIARIEKTSNFEEIQLDQLEVGMRISIDSGISGQQKITGQVKTILLNDKTPKIEIGSRWIAAKFIQKICIIPSEAGNPQIFEKKHEVGVDSSSFLHKLAGSSLPIHRALLDIRSTSKIIEDEFEWEFFNSAKSTSLKAKDMIRPIHSGHPGSGWSIVLNSSESEELAWLNLNSELSASELDADISVLCSGAAILAQLESINSKIVFSIFGRDDRQLLATELALRQKYEYSNPMSREIDVSQLHKGIELIAFEVPSNV